MTVGIYGYLDSLNLSRTEETAQYLQNNKSNRDQYARVSNEALEESHWASAQSVLSGTIVFALLTRWNSGGLYVGPTPLRAAVRITAYALPSLVCGYLTYSKSRQAYYYDKAANLFNEFAQALALADLSPQLTEEQKRQMLEQGQQLPEDRRLYVWGARAKAIQDQLY